jgi:uncharacterized protein (TIGR02217 family)
MLAFLETPRFPEQISYGSSGGPSFKTFIFEGHSGIEQSAVAWDRARHRYNAQKGITDKDDMDVVRAFFFNLRGRARGFRWKDWADYELVAEQIGVGDGAENQFPITKTYTSGALSYVRRIFKPVSGIEVRVAGVLKTEGAFDHYTIDLTTGIITFNGGSIPTLGQAVTVTGEFDVPVRLDTDQLDATHDGFLIETWGQIPIVELLLDEPA